MKKEKYICECGKEFKSQKSLSAHMASCKEHYLQRDGNLDNYYNRKNNHKHSAKIAGNKISKIVTNNWKIKKKQIEDIQKEELEQWLKEEHRCECCGKIMTEKYGSGRFCSRSCANHRSHSKETKEKISNSNTNYNNILINNKINKYNKNPNYCKICNKKLDYNNKDNKTCSQECKKLLLSKNAKLNPNCGGIRKGGGRGHSGWYKNYYCDSTWELVYVIYNINHNIPFKRCNRVYEYEYNGEKHNYHPDFELENGSLIEIKGIVDELAIIKLNSVTDRPIKMLIEDDLEYAFNYVKKTYNYQKLDDLYEK